MNIHCNYPCLYCRDNRARAGTDASSDSVIEEPDFGALSQIIKRMAESERAHTILQAKGYGRAWMSLDEIALLVPEKVEV